MTFGLLMILEDLIRLIWGPNPLSATARLRSRSEASRSAATAIRPTTWSIIAIGIMAAVFLWAFIYRTRFGVLLRATSQDKRMASALGVNVNRIYIQAFTLGCFMAGLGGAIVVPSQSAVLGMGVDALVLAFIVVVIGGLGSLEGALAGALIVGVVREAGITLFPEIELAVLYLIAARGICSSALPGLFGTRMSMGAAAAVPACSPTWPMLAWIVPVAIVLLVAPPLWSTRFRRSRSPTASSPRSRALGFNLLLGYTGLLSFGHSAYFGGGAYTVAFMVKYLKIASMEAVPRRLGARSRRSLSLLFGYVCVRYTRIFFGILTLALSQVLWSLAFKFFWVTGGTDGLRVPTPTLAGEWLRPATRWIFWPTSTTTTCSPFSSYARRSCG